MKLLLTENHIAFEEEKEFSAKFNGKVVGKFRVDFVVDNKVLVEIKAVENGMPKIFESQVLAYLKASGLIVGLLINFGHKSCIVRRFRT